MKKLILICAAACSCIGAFAQPSTITLSAGNVYYFQLPGAALALDPLDLWQTPGFISGLNPLSGDDLFFARADGGLTTIFHYADPSYPAYSGWVNNAFIVVGTAPNAFMIFRKLSGEMVWSLPAGTHFYGSDSAAATNWQNDFRASAAVRARQLRQVSGVHR